MPIPANFSIVTLGVADLERSRVFYDGLGWEMRGSVADGIVWFKTAATWLGLYGLAELATDVGLPAPESLPPFRGSTLAINVSSSEAVDEAFEVVRAIGAVVVKEPVKAEWGGYSGYFADPDGHLWEIAHAPGFSIQDGQISIP